MTHLGQPRGYSAAVLPPYNRAKAKRSRKASKLAREFIALSLDDRVLTVRMWDAASGGEADAVGHRPTSHHRTMRRGGYLATYATFSLQQDLTEPQDQGTG